MSPYSDMYGGLVLNATINLYAYCTIEETDDGMIRVRSYDDNCDCSYPLAPEIPTDDGARLIKGVYNRVVRDFGPVGKSFRITTWNDAPAGSGLGTSSTMVVCILKAFVEWMSLPLGDYEIARLAYEIERIDLKLSGGKQDQYAAAFGGFNYIEFLTDDRVIVNPLKVKRWITDELEASLILYFTGRSRSSARIIDEEKRNTSSGSKVPIEALHKIKQSTSEMKAAILKGDMGEFARIIADGWEEKKKLAGGITTPVIEEAFKVALDAGALAGKVSGAGGGGFIMFVVDPTRRKLVETALGKLDGYVVPFLFIDGGAHGWKIFETDTVNK